MEYSLRKARKLESKIRSYLDDHRGKEFVEVRSLGTLDEAKQTIESFRKDLLESIEDRTNLITVRYKIRRLIEEANESSGINYLINEKVRLNSIIQELINNVDTKPRLSDLALEDQLSTRQAALKSGNGEASMYSRRGSDATLFTTNSLLQEDLDKIEDTINNNLKEIEKIEDEINLRNLKHKITLSESDRDLLETAKLI